MRRAGLILFLSLFFSSAFAQLKLSMGGHFLAGQNIKKIVVSPEDYTVWALTNTNQIYYKSATSTDFQLYAPTVGIAVIDMAGYTFDEMYFLKGNNIIVRVMAGVTTN